MADMKAETSKGSKLMRFDRIFGMVAVLVASAALLGGCGGGGVAAPALAPTPAPAPCDACCQLRQYQESQGLQTDMGLNDIAVGTSDGVVCRNRVEPMWDTPTLLFSASKMVTGVLMLKLVDSGLLTLDTKVADVLDFWSATDARGDVTLRHLLAQTSGLQMYPGGLGQCTAENTYECGREAFEVGFPDWFTAPGESFAYSEATFYVVGAMALQVTGLQTYDDVFQQYLAQPLGMDGSRCGFVDFPPFFTKEKADPGASLVCHTLEYAKILSAIVGRTLFSDPSLHDEAETPHTLDAVRGPVEQVREPNCVTQNQTDAGCKEDRMPRWTEFGMPFPDSVYWHYGLGQWIECSTPRCEGGIVRASSIGLLGAYPWVDRSTNPPHWGLVMRWGNAGEDPAAPTRASGASVKAVYDNVVPKAAEIVQGVGSTATANNKALHF